ncbi:MAG TPA: response regulator transcription factor [Firmicutes bacterium]|nr:response regulator transcription factor [Bacillota bacterium]
MAGDNNNKKKLRILLVDDHPVIRKGLQMIIHSQPGMEVVGEAGSVSEALTIAGEKQPDLIILDLSLPDSSGIHFLRKIRKENPAVRILVLTIHADEDYLQEVMREGANGYLLKNVADEELISAIKAVMREEIILDPGMTKKLLQRYLLSEKNEEKEKRAEKLSRRQKQILSLIARGYTDKQISEAIHVSVKTVESHKARIKEKLNITQRSELVRYALEHGLIKLPE